MCTSSPSTGQRAPVCPEPPLRRAVRVQHSRQLGPLCASQGSGTRHPRVCQARMQSGALGVAPGYWPVSLGRGLLSKCADTARGDLRQLTETAVPFLLLRPCIGRRIQKNVSAFTLPPLWPFAGRRHRRKARDVCRKRKETTFLKTKEKAQHRAFPRGPPPQYYPGSNQLNFAVRMGSGEPV